MPLPIRGWRSDGLEQLRFRLVTTSPTFDHEIIHLVRFSSWFAALQLFWPSATLRGFVLVPSGSMESYIVPSSRGTPSHSISHCYCVMCCLLMYFTSRAHSTWGFDYFPNCTRVFRRLSHPMEGNLDNYRP